MPWEAILRVAAFLILELVLLGGLLAIPLGLSGNFIILGAALAAAVATRFHAITLVALLVMAGGVVIGEVIESLLGSIMARRYGASKWGMIGAFVGGIAGAALGTPIAPILGTLVGSFVGAAAGAIVFEYIHLRKLQPSMPAGWGAILGKLASSLIKVAIGLAMVAYLQVRLLPVVF